MSPGLSSPEPEDGGAVALNCPVPHSASAAAATNTPESARSALGSGNDGSGDLRASSSMGAVEALAAILEPEAFDECHAYNPSRRAEAQSIALHHAARVLGAGFRRLVEDDDTIERLAAILAKADGWFPWDQPPDVEQEVAVVDDVKDGFRSMARAAVRALREETSKHASGADFDLRERGNVAGQVRASGTADACCPRCTARTGSCVRCGVRDAVAWELCGQCDREVEAEAARGSAALREGQ